ncbi:uncharacterized protein LOC126907932 [Daktulosphaira vitifoliae]|uniref:uncharacterized protein LOC126907932 n=1 Tax=Daktulosphaira vitifoliae TaxID=58002 RepID=UPI0021AA05E2|nr:uncharacterized protein LOC126907932 [Daktulosphaira vitifoliae]
MIFKNIIILTHIYYAVGIWSRDLQCNFTMYMLNYFNHNHRYLIEINNSKNLYNEEELKLYGVAIQSHGEIVLIMLETLQNMYSKNMNYYSKELMAINLYLNNVSGYTDMLATDEENKIDLSDVKSSIIQGYLMIHKFISFQLKNYTENVCKNFSYDQIFVLCPNYNSTGNYNLENLIFTTNKLRDRLLLDDCQQNITDVNIKFTKNSGIFKKIKKTFHKGKYWKFHPKNILLYDFMTNRHKISERDLLSRAQARQHQILENDCPTNVLDILRFAPLTLSCSDGSQVTLYDFFRYVKYSFFRVDVQFFHTLVLTATFRPISLLIQNYLRILSSSTSIYDLDKPNFTESTFFNNMNIVGSRIIYYFQYFINLEIFGKDPNDFFKSILHRTIQCIYYFKLKKKEDFFTEVNMLIKSLENLMLNNRIDYRISVAIITITNIDVFYNDLLVNMNQIQDYITELEHHLESFISIKETFKVEYLFKSTTYVLRPIIISHLCQENVYSFLEKLKTPNHYLVKNEEVSTSDENSLKKEINIDKTTNRNIQEEFFLVPKMYASKTISSFRYLENYILFF